jgi:hypothetical protein
MSYSTSANYIALKRSLNPNYDANSSSYLASLINGLLPLILLPYLSSTTGIKLNTNATPPNRLLAHLNPNVLYILCVANGKNAAMQFSKNAIPATALAAYFAYASTTYVVTAAILQNMPNPTKDNAMLGTIHGTRASELHAKKKRPPISPIKDAGILKYNRASGTGRPGHSALPLAEAKYILSCHSDATKPMSSPMTIADWTSPVP